MGIYNQQQIRQLQSQLNDVSYKHNKLVEVVQHQDDEIDQLDKTVFSIAHVLRSVYHHNSGNIAAKLGRITNQMNQRLDVATHVIQSTSPTPMTSCGPSSSRTTYFTVQQVSTASCSR